MKKKKLQEKDNDQKRYDKMFCKYENKSKINNLTFKKKKFCFLVENQDAILLNASRVREVTILPNQILIWLRKILLVLIMFLK